MIDYKQLSEGIPPDVEMITDDSNGEMADLQEMMGECEFDFPLPEERGEDGNFHIIIPGSEVGEFSEMVWDIDNGKLDRLTEKWNRETIKAAESD